MNILKSSILSLTLLASATQMQGESVQWLANAKGGNAEVKVLSKPSATTDIATAELRSGASLSAVTLQCKSVKGLTRDAYTVTIKGGKAQLVSPTDAGLLYASYDLLRLQSQKGTLLTIDTTYTEIPEHDLRLLNHWDNLDGTMERGYSGRSIFWPNDATASEAGMQHLIGYARANASVGINGVVLNNVNASPKMLSAEILQQVKRYADVLRPYGIRVYLAVNFSSPAVLDKLPTSDPLDARVAQWWKSKAKEIYKLIPDFGGFLVKANSEGQPGPMDFGRTHADGANMLAKALKPYGGIVMWRAFVYSPSDPDRAKQAYIEFHDLDGKFMDNVIIQIKNGPVDFQPREPFSALFGAMPRTAEMAEVQITQEYLGHSNHICFLSTMWEEFLTDVKRYANYHKSLGKPGQRSIAGVANVGSDANYCGNVFAQANWYAFGRLAWNSDLRSRDIAREWISQTFPSAHGEQFDAISQLMMQSRENVVDYMMPLGLHHIFAEGHHYGPQPWQNNPGQRADWQCVYYHRADAKGVGFDRTAATGSAATRQYPAAFGDMIEDINSCPDKYLLWFHHASWTHKCQSGRTLWQEMCYRYQHGLDGARQMLRQWNSVEAVVPHSIFTEILSRLQIQVRDAEWWKDACLLYFQTFSRQPIPDFVEPPVHSLDELKSVKLGISNYECPSRQLLNSKR